MFSIFTGLGMKPISQPSFTRRPIHQSLLNFYTTEFKSYLEDPPRPSANGRHHFPENYYPEYHLHLLIEELAAHLFDMEEVFSLKGDGHAWHRDIIIMTWAVADICADSKCNWFALHRRNKGWTYMKMSNCP